MSERRSIIYWWTFRLILCFKLNTELISKSSVSSLRFSLERTVQPGMSVPTNWSKVYFSLPVTCSVNSPPPLPRDLDRYPPRPPQYCCCWYCSFDTATFISHWRRRDHLLIPHPWSRDVSKVKTKTVPCWVRCCGTSSPWSSSLTPPLWMWWSRSPSFCLFCSPWEVQWTPTVCVIKERRKSHWSLKWKGLGLI